MGKIVKKEKPKIDDFERKKRVHEIWKRLRHEKTAKNIFVDHLGDYFETKEFSWTDSGWLCFCRWVNEWTKDEEAKERTLEAEKMTDEELLNIQEMNRKKTVLMLRDALNKYERNPKFFRKLTVEQVSKLYQIVQSAEEASRRTELAKKKIGLEVAKSFFLPYQRMSTEDLKSLKEFLNASIDRILQLKGVENT